MNGQTDGRQGSFPCLITTLNEKGLGLVSGEHFEVGEEIRISWVMGPREPALDILCVVRNTGETQVGVEFLNLPLADRMRISHFLITTSGSAAKQSAAPSFSRVRANEGNA